MKDRGQKTGTQFLAGLAIGLCYVWLIADAKAASAASVSALGLCAKVIVPSLFPFFVCSNLFCALGLERPMERVLSRVVEPLFGVQGGAFRGAHGRISVRRAERGRALWRRKHRSENSKKAASFLQQLRPCVSLRRCRAISLWKQPCGASSVSRACCIFPFARHFRPKKRPYAGKDRPGRRKRSVRFLLIRADRERQKIGADSAGGLHVRGRLRRCDGDGANGAPAGSPRLGACDCIGAS